MSQDKRWQIVVVAVAGTLLFAQRAQPGAPEFSPSAQPAEPNRVAAAPDLVRGELLFQTCAACHNPLGDGVGPDLRGIYGRKAGMTPGFNYSAALKNSHIVWDDTALRAFVKDPQSLVKGTIMSFPGYPAPSDVDDVIAYLKTFR